MKVNLYFLQFTQETTNHGIQSVANYSWLGLNEMRLLVWISVRLALTSFFFIDYDKNSYCLDEQQQCCCVKPELRNKTEADLHV